MSDALDEGLGAVVGQLVNGGSVGRAFTYGPIEMLLYVLRQDI